MSKLSNTYFFINTSKYNEYEKMISTLSLTTEKVSAQEMNKSLRLKEQNTYSLKNENNKVIAVMNINGVLFKSYNMLYSWFGIEQSSYSQIQSDLKHIQSDNSIDEIELRVNSPGGNVEGYFETIRTLQSITKPITAYIGSMGCSAAYGICAQADKIYSEKWSVIGSVGVIATFTKYDKELEKYGIEEFTFRGKQSPNKNPDPATSEGSKKIQKHIDELGELFYQSVAEGRKQDYSYVLKNYLAGDVCFGNNAKENNMIDIVIDENNKENDTITLSSNEPVEKLTVEVVQNKKIKGENMEKEKDLTTQQNDNTSNEKVINKVAEVSKNNNSYKESIKNLCEKYPDFENKIIKGAYFEQDVLAIENDILKEQLTNVLTAKSSKEKSEKESQLVAKNELDEATKNEVADFEQGEVAIEDNSNPLIAVANNMLKSEYSLNNNQKESA